MTRISKSHASPPPFSSATVSSCPGLKAPLCQGAALAVDLPWGSIPYRNRSGVLVGRDQGSVINLTQPVRAGAVHGMEKNQGGLCLLQDVADLLYIFESNAIFVLFVPHETRFFFSVPPPAEPTGGLSFRRAKGVIPIVRHSGPAGSSMVGDFLACRNGRGPFVQGPWRSQPFSLFCMDSSLATGTLLADLGEGVWVCPRTQGRPRRWEPYRLNG